MANNKQTRAKRSPAKPAPKQAAKQSAKSIPTESEPIIANRVERILAFMVAAAIGLSILCFIALIVATGLGLKNFNSPPWPTIIVLPFPGLIIGLLLVITLIIVSGLRRGREARDAQK